MNNQTKSSQLILGASVDGDILTNNFFSEENNKIFDIMRNPPYLRYSGWNLLTLDYPRLKNGEWWEVQNGDRKTIRLYEDGTFVASAYADNTFLGWGKGDKEFLEAPSLRSLAIVEYVYEFVNVYREILQALSLTKGKITFEVKLINTTLTSGKKLSIGTSNVFALFPEVSEEIDGDKSGEITINVNGSFYDSKYEAYKLLSRIYRWFNVPDNKIPYTGIDDSGARFIDLQSFMEK
jgi:hypothetical protein